MTENNYEPIEVYWDYEGERVFEEEMALAVLLRDGVIFCNGFIRSREPQEFGITLYVLCNDIFAWGMADLEDFDEGDIQPLYDMHVADPKWGTYKWCCIHRNQKPQEPVEEAMKKDGSWDEVMEALPEGQYREYMRERREERKRREEETNV